MQIFTQKTLGKATTLVVLLCFGFNYLFAQDVTSDLSANRTSLEVGQTVVVNLFVEPKTGTSIYTVSANLVYDPTKLTFQSASVNDRWLNLAQSETSVTDTVNGLIIRTGGYPGGFSENTKFVTYRFVARQAGDTGISLTTGNAYNENNDDLGIARSNVYLSVNDGKVSVDAPVPEKIIDVKVSLESDNAFYRQDPYKFTVYHKSEEKTQQAITKIWLFDEDLNVVYEDEKLWRTDKDNVLDFIIPADSVKSEGNFKIVAKVRYEDARENEVAAKDIGILSNGKTWFTKNSSAVFPFFFLVACISILHHMFVEREIYFRLQQLLKSRNKIKDK